MSADSQRIKWCRNIAENFNRLSRAHERYTDRRQTDGRPMSSRSLKMLDEENISNDDARIAETPRRLLMVFIRRCQSVLSTQRKAVEKWEIRPLQYPKAKRHMVIEKNTPS